MLGSLVSIGCLGLSAPALAEAPMRLARFQVHGAVLWWYTQAPVLSG
jgi:hypothetical protein